MGDDSPLTSKSPPPPSTPPPSSIPKSATQCMTPSEISTHVQFMREALSMADLALQTSETPVGCVFVHRGRIIGRGMNATNRTRNGTRHAEFLALDEIMRARDADGKKPRYTPEMLRECDLYVTVEPCIMCASLLRQVGIRKVFFGAANEKFGGTGGVLSIHVGNGRKAGDGVEGVEVEGGEEWERWHRDDYEVSGGWLREEAIVLLRRFYVQENDRAPEPRSKKDRVLKLEVEPMGEEGKMGDGSAS